MYIRERERGMERFSSAGYYRGRLRGEDESDMWDDVTDSSI